MGSDSRSCFSGGDRASRLGNGTFTGEGASPGAIRINDRKGLLMATISDTAVFTVNVDKLRIEVINARTALTEQINGKYNDRRELVLLMQTGDPMEDQAAEESDDVRAIEAEISRLREDDAELARLVQMIDMHRHEVIDISHEMLDPILELANQVREEEAVAA